MTRYIAQGLTVNGTSVRGPLVNITSLGDVINRLMVFLFPLAAVILFLIFIWGGYDFLMSQGEPEKVKVGKDKMTAGVIGFALLVFSFLIAKLLGSTFGLGGGIL